MNLPTAYNRFMTRFSHVAGIASALLALAACGAAPPPAASHAAPAAMPRDRLSRIVDHYWDEHIAGAGTGSAQDLADSLAAERRFLAEILTVPRTALDPGSRLTYDIFRRQRELAVEGYTYPVELLAVDPFGGKPVEFARLAAAAGLAPMPAVKDYENWRRQIDAYVAWTRQAIENMREGIHRGYTSPRAVIERSLPVLQRLGGDTPANVFYAPLQAMPETITDPERTRLTADLGNAVREQLLPAYRALHDFLQREYLPRARLSPGLSALPLGASWYAYRVRVATGGTLTPNEIHSIGVTEVERIRARLAASAAGTAGAMGAASTTGAPGATGGADAAVAASTTAPTGAASTAAAAGVLLSGYADLKARTLAAMPSLFSAVPPTDFEIRAEGTWDVADGPLWYRTAAPGMGRPAILYVDTGATAARAATLLPAMFLLEAIPGRHYQASLQHARADLPRFRRFGTEPAFTQGWALYAASLGEELGVYPEEEARKEALFLQLRCAAALVVDTGLHAQGWTRVQALDYLRAQLGLNDVDANLLVDRFLAEPGDALACKIGELKIQGLRNRAQQALGARFDIREFHSEILGDGAMPLDILEAKIKLWMESRR